MTNLETLVRNQITAIIKRHDDVIATSSKIAGGGPIDPHWLEELEDETLHLVSEALGTKRSACCYLPTLDSLVKKYL